MSVAITGATGFVGQAVLDAANRQGIAIRALTRRAQQPREGVTWIEGALSDSASLDRLIEGAEAVIHIAGLTNAPDPKDFHQANVIGTRNLLWTMVRPPAVYGPRDRDMLELFRAARFGVVPVPPRGRTSIIHVDDLAECLLALGARTGSGEIVEPDDGHPNGYEHAELAKLIGRAVGKRVVAPHLPAPLLHLAAKADRALRGDKAKLTPDRAGYMAHPDWVCDPARALPVEVWKPRIIGPDGLKQTADWYRAQGWL